MHAAEKQCHSSGYVVFDASDWQIIPAENLVAAFQDKPAQLMGVAATATDGQVMLEALEVGTAGVVLRTEDAGKHVRTLAHYVAKRNRVADRLQWQPATVFNVTPVGMGDRVCVDLCSMLMPGEGMLVGSFARAMFLVHSECAESRYINSRPFRVNAGPVHSYTVAGSTGRTAYLAELKSGSEVQVADVSGRQRQAIVGRCKIENRPLQQIDGLPEAAQQHWQLILAHARSEPLAEAEALHLLHVCLEQEATGLRLEWGSICAGAALRPKRTLAQQMARGKQIEGVNLEEFDTACISMFDPNTWPQTRRDETFVTQASKLWTFLTEVMPPQDRLQLWLLVNRACTKRYLNYMGMLWERASAPEAKASVDRYAMGLTAGRTAAAAAGSSLGSEAAAAAAVAKPSSAGWSAGGICRAQGGGQPNNSEPCWIWTGHTSASQPRGAVTYGVNAGRQRGWRFAAQATLALDA
eukprot:jgi/Astpho2/5587/fgenesh1_pg.00079_%23_44_t